MCADKGSALARHRIMEPDSSSRVSATSRRPTVADVAARAKVSKGAVSFALNGSPGVSVATRERILAAARELGWHPNRAARALSQAHSETVGLVVNRPMRTLGVEPFFTQFSSGLTVELAEHGFSLQIFIVSSQQEELDTYQRWWTERRTDGIVLMDPTSDDARLQRLVDLGMPTVVAGELPPQVATAGVSGTKNLSTVRADDAAAMSDCIDHLTSCGHLRIGYVCGTTEYLHIQRRRDLLESARTDGVLTEAMVLATDFGEAEGARCTTELLDLVDPPTAIIYDSDVLALSGLAALQQRGVDVPARMSIVSFHDSLLTRATHPALTALSQDTFEFGMLTARTLIASLTDDGRPISVEAPAPTLTVRHSTAAPQR